jgi:hypothetical protein
MTSVYEKTAEIAAGSIPLKDENKKAIENYIMTVDNEPKIQIPKEIKVALEIEEKTGMDFNTCHTAARQLLSGHEVYFDDNHTLTVNPLDSTNPDEG